MLVRSRLLVAVAALAVGSASAQPASAANSAGYMVINALSEAFEQSGNVVILSGTLTNACAATLPAGSAFVFDFDGVPFTGFALTALANGSVQQFSAYGSLPQNLPQPRKNTTSLGFAIALPKTRFAPQGEAKTSPCLVTFAAGIPAE